MPSSDLATAASETSIDAAVIERVGDRASLSEQALADALVVVHAELIGRHAAYERQSVYVTRDGVRAYRVDEAEWNALANEMGFDEAEAEAVRAAHTEQARLMFAAAIDASEDFAVDEAGVVVGVDTAEQF